MNEGRKREKREVMEKRRMGGWWKDEERGWVDGGGMSREDGWMVEG